MHLGRDRVICAYEVNGLIIDPGPGSCVETLLEQLGPAKPRALLLTHIHLDHAGASGVLCRRFPDLRVYVHEVGAPHLVDPSKLLESAGRLYGDDMWELWGEVAPVPEDRIHVLSGGETVEGFRVAYTPGHASHHVCYLDGDGTLYAGDAAGVRILPSSSVLPPTPPPEVDLEAWAATLDEIERRSPERLALIHFGVAEDPQRHLDELRERLGRWSERVRDGVGEEQFGELAAADLGADREAYQQAMPFWQSYAGLKRYWEKHAA
jgi:glyoxylase-like metal-dependent hydrolase (beta-lactamase superfamily II)